MRLNQDSNTAKTSPEAKAVKPSDVYSAWHACRELVNQVDPSELDELFVRIPKVDGTVYRVERISTDVYVLFEEPELRKLLESKTSEAPKRRRREV